LKSRQLHPASRTKTNRASGGLQPDALDGPDTPSGIDVLAIRRLKGQSRAFCDDALGRQRS
jgi:hypothetical protein